MVDEDKIQRMIGAGSDELEPLDDKPAQKTLAEVSAEHPEWAGLAQLVSYLYSDNPDAFTEARAGRPPKPLSGRDG